MRQIDELAQDVGFNMWSTWYKFVEKYEPIANPENQASYFFDSDSEALPALASKQVWLVYRPWGQDLNEYSFIVPCFYEITDFEDLGDDGEGYIVTEKRFDGDFAVWRDSPFQSMQVKVSVSCECGDTEPECENCEGQGPGVDSCLEQEEEGED